MAIPAAVFTMNRDFNMPGIVMTDLEYLDLAENTLQKIEAACDRINETTDVDIDNQRNLRSHGDPDICPRWPDCGEFAETLARNLAGGASWRLSLPIQGWVLARHQGRGAVCAIVTLRQ